MPRTSVELEYPVEYLSIVDKNSGLDDDLLKQMFRTMPLARHFDERPLGPAACQRRIRTCAPVKGWQACQIGVMAALEEADWSVPALREFAAIPDDKHDLPISVSVASQVIRAAGLGYRDGRDRPDALAQPRCLARICCQWSNSTAIDQTAIGLPQTTSGDHDDDSIQTQQSTR